MPVSLAVLQSKFDKIREIFAELIASMETQFEMSKIPKKDLKNILDMIISNFEIGIRYSDQLLYIAEQSESAMFREMISDILVQPLAQIEDQMKKIRKEKTLRNPKARKEIKERMKTRRAKITGVISCLRSKTVRFKGFRTKSTPLMNQLMRMYKGKVNGVVETIEKIKQSNPKLFNKMKDIRRMLKLVQKMPELYAKINLMAPISPSCALEERKQHIEAALKSANSMQMLLNLISMIDSKK
jgi:hypothetical protein